MNPVGLIKGAIVLGLCAALAIGAAAAQPDPANAKNKRYKSPIMRGFKEKIDWGPLSSAKARKKVKRTNWEPRPSNRRANRTVPTKRQLRYFRRNQDRNNMPYFRRINGQMRGTTDDIIQWAAKKWGLPPRVLRGAAVVETWWYNDFVGDNGDSFGLFQMRRPWHCCLPFMRTSTAFNADYYGAILRSYYDGKQVWLHNEGIAEHNGRPYRAGDFWGAVGAWYAGKWRVPESAEYVAMVKREATKRTWRTHPYFAE
jgi:hypothetical protein